ncbi:hypothetical protein BGX27_011278 [Mortierella sp. AM989]|nr:hypothetical protein BGX27_011278 [Mortierella sp. AM989]
MSTTNLENKNMPKVLIVGAGIAGLMLGILFESLDIPYHIFDRASTVRPLGSALGLGSNTLPVFEQLGLYEEIMKFSIPFRSMEIFDHELHKLGSVKLDHKQLGGYDNVLFARPKFHELLLKQIPVDKISFNKKIVKTEEKDGKTIIQCSDNSIYDGDILVGADGAYSGVRQSLYKRLNEKGVLPEADLEDLAIGYIGMLGIATPKNPEKYPQLKDEATHCTSVIGTDNKSWQTITISHNQISWGMGIALPKEEAEAMRFKNSEWGPESNEAMIKNINNLPCPLGGTLGELIEDTPKELISKIFLEEKNFLTWHHGRTVLIGDAAHKVQFSWNIMITSRYMFPWGGQGAANAIQDAVVLANCIFNMPDMTSESITAAFEDYYKQRHHRAAEQIERSRENAKVMTDQSWVQKLVRHVLFNYLPDWVMQRGYVKVYEYRPQIAWLPLIENRGKGKVLPQENRRRVVEKKAQAVQ